MTFSPLLESLLERIRRKEVDEDTLAAELRAIAMQHLRNGQGPVARAFRGFGDNLILDDKKAGISSEDYINKQKNSGEWETYIGLCALGEVFGFNSAVTPITKGVPQYRKNGQPYEPPMVFATAEDANAPSIHLFNSDNTHWHVELDPKSTRGNGNCLFNGIAQKLQALAVAQTSTNTRSSYTPASPRSASSNVTSSTPVSVARAPQASFSHSSDQSAAILQQKSILDALKAMPKPSEVQKQLDAEEIRFNKLSPAEQAQIRSDHALALQLACEFVKTPAFLGNRPKR